MRDLEDEKRIKEYMAAKMTHIKMYNECMNLADGLDIAKFAELVRADERERVAQWVDLTDEEILDCWKQAYEPGHREHMNAMNMARTVEAKLKEKNT